MNAEVAIEAVVRDRLGVGIRSSDPLAGGSIHDVRRLSLADGGTCVVKVADIVDASMLHGEATGLDALKATATVRTPAVLGISDTESCTVLITEYLAPCASGSADWDAFGSRLGELHSRGGADQYGFSEDNHLGRTPQSNGWSDDWVEFLALHRLGPQLRLARDGARLGPSQAAAIDSIIDRLDRLVPRHPHPSLLHGDLWSGNALPLSDGGVAVLDPACSYGDAWFDIGMMRLFGGFPEECFAAWAAGRDDHAQSAERIAVAKLYHLLNHLNLFGGGYRPQVEEMVRTLA